jgi:hypothetical protein
MPHPNRSRREATPGEPITGGRHPARVRHSVMRVGERAAQSVPLASHQDDNCSLQRADRATQTVALIDCFRDNCQRRAKTVAIWAE